MKIIRPTTITDAMITDSNVPETDYAAYAAGTTYYGGDRVIVVAAHKIYESLPPSPSGREILTLDVAPATPWLPDWILTGQTSFKTCKVVAQITSLTYYVTDRSGDFTLGEVIGVTGTAALLADQGAAKPTFGPGPNVGHYPPTDLLLETPLWWKEISATNRWKAFDNKVGSQVSQATSITYKITPGEVVDSIAFLNLDAAEVTILSTDPVDGVVYNKTVNLLTTVIVGTVMIMDWYTYFFSSIVKITDFVKFDIPPYLNNVFDIAISNLNGTAKCGGIVMGLQTILGATLYSPAIGIHDYSKKEVDDYGVYSVTAGAFSKRMSCDLKILNTSIDEIQNLLAFYRAIPLVWIGIEEYSSLIVFGFFKDFNIVIPHPYWSECSIEIEGLT